MDLAPQPRDAADVPPLPCLCASLRRAARAVSQIYDANMRVAGLRGTQHTLLQMLRAREGITQNELGRRLALDTTTLSRTLRPLEQRGWIRSRPGTDRRERRLALTLAGRRQIERARPHWQRAQERMRKRLGAEQWEQVMGALWRVTQAAYED